jgi:hypothetical protein
MHIKVKYTTDTILATYSDWWQQTANFDILAQTANSSKIHPL